jgi:hypothetical protein
VPLIAPNTTSLSLSPVLSSDGNGSNDINNDSSSDNGGSDSDSDSSCSHNHKGDHHEIRGQELHDEEATFSLPDEGMQKRVSLNQMTRWKRADGTFLRECVLRICCLARHEQGLGR